MDVQKKNASEERRLARRISVTLVAAACGLWTLAPSAFAEVTPPSDTQLPVFKEVVAGTVETPVTTGSTMDIKQTSERAIIKWDSFDVGKDATVNFIQTKDGVQNTAAITLNRVVGNDLSQIYGKINSIGSVVLVNQNGILFADGSSVNAAGIVASTADIANDKNFIDSGELKFVQTNASNNNITVLGSLNAAISGSYLDSSVADSYGAYLATSPLNLGERQVVTELSTVGNKIMLVADGDVKVGSTGALTATTTTNVAATTVTKDLGNGFTLTTAVDAQSADGTIIMRADQNADDVNGDSSAATIVLENDDSKIQAKNIYGYYNDAFTATGIAIITGVTPTTNITFNQKKYNSSDTLSTKVTADSKNFYSLVNNVYQLQAIEDSTDGNLAGNYALGKDIDASATTSWNSDAGFNPIGDSSNAFTGKFTGDGGTGTYKIYDLTINRSSEYNVGLFANTNNATITDVTMVDPTIVGYTNVGGIVGKSENTSFTNVTMRKRVYDLDDNTTTTTADADNVKGYESVGGIAGNVSNSTLTDVVNGGQVTGTSGTGGVVGAVTGSTLQRAVNKGYYSADGYAHSTSYNDGASKAEDVTHGYGVVSSGATGGIAANATSTTISDSWSNGKVTGGGSTGGIVGVIGNGTTITRSYNTNEAEPGKGIEVTTADTEKSIYGTVTGEGSSGGIVGEANGTNMSITECYNAGNITGTGSASAGGIIGLATGGSLTIENCYNADNNTVLVDSSNYAGFKYHNTTADADYEYAYDTDTGLWYNKTLDAAKKTLLTDKQLQAEAPMSGRLYNTRLAYRDATVTSENGTAGGIAGTITKVGNSYNQPITIKNSYSVGAISGKTAGGMIGSGYQGNHDGNSFYVTTQNINGSLAGSAKSSVASYSSPDPEDVGAPMPPEGKTLWEAQNFTFSDSDAWYYSYGSTTPMLKAFMTGGTISRASTEYAYDATSHHLDTSGITGYYGSGAFSTGINDANFGQGINVNSDGVDVATDAQLANVTYTTKDATTADAAGSSFYSYANSNLWSGQHGYMTSADSGLVVTPKGLSFATAESGTKVYGYTVDASSLGSFSGLVDGDNITLGTLAADAYTVKAEGDEEATALTATTNAGTYTLGVDAAKVNEMLAAADTSGNYKLGTVTGSTYTITPREVTYAISGATKTYGETTIDGTTGTWSDNILETDKDTLTGLAIDTSAIESSDGGLLATAKVKTLGYEMSATDALATKLAAAITAANSNYKLADGGARVTEGAKLVVNPRIVKFNIEDATKVYGDSTLTGGFSNLVNGDNLDGLGITAITGSDVTDTTNAGTVDVTLDNYAISDFVIAKGEGNYLLAAEDDNTLTGGLEITARAIGYKVGDQTKTYGDNSTLSSTGVFTNLFEGSAFDGKSLTVDDLESDGLDSADLTHKGQVNGGQAYSLKVKDNAVADYIAAINKASGNNNYVLSSAEGAVEDGTLKVNARSVTFDLGKQAITYGDKTIAGNFTTVVEGDDLGAITADVLSSGSDVLNGTTGVKGDHAITIDVTKLAKQVTENGNGNYTLDAGNSTLSGNLTINAKELTYTLADQTLQYGDKASTGTLTGFVNGDSIATDGLKVTEGGAGSLTSVADKSYSIGVAVKDVADLVAKNGNDNYTIAADGNKYNGTVTVTARQIGYTVGDQTKTYGDGADGISGTGSFTNLFTGSELEGATLAASDLTSDGLGEQANVKTDGTTYTLTVADKASLEKLIAAKGGSNYVLSDDVTSGTLTVNAKDINYSVGSLNREYLTDGGYTGADATASGVMNWDADKLANINYTTDATLTSDAQGGYTIGTTVDAVQTALGTNYNVTGVTDGTLTITPTTVYYKADALSYNKKDGDLVLTGALVKADGTTVLGTTDAKQYLTDADYAALKFVVVDADGKEVDTTAGIDKGEYSIIGTGITGGQNYVLGNPSDWYTNNGAKAAMLTVLSSATADIVPDLGQYEGAKDDLGTSQSSNNGAGFGGDDLLLRRGGIIGGAIPSMDRVQYSFKSVESTGINVGTAPQAIYSVTVAPSSYAANNGGGNVTLAEDQDKPVRIARDGDGAARRIGMNDEQENHVTLARDAAGAARAVGMNAAQENHVSMANSADNSSDEDEQKKA